MIEIIPTGHDAVHPQPGDILFVHRNGFASSLIRFFERAFGGDARWSHIAVCDDVRPGDMEPMLIEALTKGVCRHPLSEYREIEYGICRMQMSREDGSQAAAFLFSCIGERYAWGTILSIGVRYFTGRSGFALGGSSTKICSVLAAQTAVRSWPIYPHDPQTITPGELAAYHATHSASNP